MSVYQSSPPGREGFGLSVTDGSLLFMKDEKASPPPPDGALFFGKSLGAFEVEGDGDGVMIRYRPPQTIGMGRWDDRW
jgi:hypothetical protein